MLHIYLTAAGLSSVSSALSTGRTVNSQPFPMGASSVMKGPEMVKTYQKPKTIF